MVLLRMVCMRATYIFRFLSFYIVYLRLQISLDNTSLSYVFALITKFKRWKYATFCLDKIA
uniref:Uncharacterized protein n=1 Tax=Arundo donax TaxID=35708 RepID=A0A0A9FT44_ARUDO